MKKRNKKYRPKPIDIEAANKVIRLCKPIQEDSKQRLNEKILGSLEAVSKGAGNTDHFNILASTVDVVYLISKELFQDAYADEIDQARKAMFRMVDRYNQHETIKFDGKGYQEIKNLIAIHDQMLDNLTGLEMLQFMKARAIAINNGNFYNGKDKRVA